MLGVELRSLGVELLRVELLRVELWGLGVEMRGLMGRRSLVVKLIGAVLLLHKLVLGLNVVQARWRGARQTVHPGLHLQLLE